MGIKKEAGEGITFAQIEEVQQYFENNRVLSQACEELEIPYTTTRDYIKRPAGKMPLDLAIKLINWVALWQRQQETLKILKDRQNGHYQAIKAEQRRMRLNIKQEFKKNLTGQGGKS